MKSPWSGQCSIISIIAIGMLSSLVCRLHECWTAKSERRFSGPINRLNYCCAIFQEMPLTQLLKTFSVIPFPGWRDWTAACLNGLLAVLYGWARFMRPYQSYSQIDRTPPLMIESISIAPQAGLIARLCFMDCESISLGTQENSE